MPKVPTNKSFPSFSFSFASFLTVWPILKIFFISLFSSLKSKEPNLNIQDEQSRSPLMILAQKQNFEMVSLLVRMQADIHLEDY